MMKRKYLEAICAVLLLVAWICLWRGVFMYGDTNSAAVNFCIEQGYSIGYGNRASWSNPEKEDIIPNAWVEQNGESYDAHVWKVHCYTQNKLHDNNITHFYNDGSSINETPYIEPKNVTVISIDKCQTMWDFSHPNLTTYSCDDIRNAMVYGSYNAPEAYQSSDCRCRRCVYEHREDVWKYDYREEYKSRCTDGEQ